MKTPGLWREAAQNLRLHKARSILAILGVVFGVASIICMLSISEVAKRDVASRIRRMGLRNVILDSVKPQEVQKQEQRASQGFQVARYGLTREDLGVLREGLPQVKAVVPMRVLLQDVRSGAAKTDIRVIATTPDYAWVLEHVVERGRFFAPLDEERAAPVCVLGHDAARTLFPLADPIGQFVKIGNYPFQVAGVLERKGPVGSGDLSSPDNVAYIPFSTSFAMFGHLQIRQGEGSFEATELAVHRAVLRVSSETFLSPVSQAARNRISQAHSKKDVDVTVPYALLEEHRRAERMFLWVMGSIAAISLLVGGIGIMNIMLANVAERRAEVGLRRALGATRGDILKLFLGESTLLCIVGGVLGLAVGIGLALGVGTLAGWAVTFQPLAFPLGLGVAVFAGLLFGTFPARQAARLDPIRALRAE